MLHLSFPCIAVTQRTSVAKLLPDLTSWLLLFATPVRLVLGLRVSPASALVLGPCLSLRARSVSISVLSTKAVNLCFVSMVADFKALLYTAKLHPRKHVQTYISPMDSEGSTKQDFQSQTSLGSCDMRDSIILLLTCIMKMQHSALYINHFSG